MNDLVVATEKTYRGFRISGQGMVDAFKASAAAAGAGRQDVASFFDEIISRGKMTGRSFVGFGDITRFRNAGLDINALYKELGVSAGQAARGAIVSTDKMAAALRKVSENRFAEINGKKMLSLGAQWDRFKDNLMRLTNELAGEGGALEPLLKAIKGVADAFDLSTTSGQALKDSITKYGKALADAIVKHLPDIKAFVVEAIKLTGAFIEGVAAVVKWSQSAEGMMIIKSVLYAIAVTVGVLVAAFAVLGAIVATPFVLLAGAIYGVMKAWNWITSINWGGIGTAIVDGIKNGLTENWNKLKNAVVAMGQGIKDTFTSILHIGSPSKDFLNYGVNLPQSTAQGVIKGTPAVTTATTAMASEAKAGAVAGGAASASAPEAAGGGGRGVTIGTIEVNIQVSGGAHAEENKATLSSPTFLGMLADSVRAVIQTQASTTTQVVPSGG